MSELISSSATAPVVGVILGVVFIAIGGGLLTVVGGLLVFGSGLLLVVRLIGFLGKLGGGKD